MSANRPVHAAGSPFARSVWLVLRKDLTVEVRSGEIAYTTLFFAASCVLIFAFALVKEGRAPEGGAAGILWIAILFAATLALGRGFERERQSETLRALLLAPVPRPAIYVGKLLGIVTLLVAIEAVLLPLVAFGRAVRRRWICAESASRCRRSCCGRACTIPRTGTPGPRRT